MSTILFIIQACGIIIQKGIDLHRAGLDEALFEQGKDLVHKLKQEVDKLHAKHVTNKDPKPDATDQKS